MWIIAKFRLNTLQYTPQTWNSFKDFLKLDTKLFRQLHRLHTTPRPLRGPGAELSYVVVCFDGEV